MVTLQLQNPYFRTNKSQHQAQILTQPSIHSFPHLHQNPTLTRIHVSFLGTFPTKTGRVVVGVEEAEGDIGGKGRIHHQLLHPSLR